MWDFVGITLGMLYQIPPSSPRTREHQKEIWNDVLSRNSMAAELLLDSQRGMLDMMVDSSYPAQQRGSRPEIGDDVKEAARKLKNG